MSPSRFARIETLFLKASDLPVDERRPFLEQSCGDDTKLLRDVLGLLERDSDPHAVFAMTLESMAGVAMQIDEDGTGIPAQIGVYHIIRRLGEGGMAVVYLARQPQPEREVAVKVLKTGLATRDRMRRFRLEMQVLGQLHHPGIARVYDAGSHDFGDGSRPFFVMEYVDGPPITEFSSRSGLSIEARLRLMIAVCQAVNHAHQRGVIHRDLKPGNILVHVEQIDDAADSTATGSDVVSIVTPVTNDIDPGGRAIVTPKILDFGVARAVGAEFDATSMHTDAGQLVGTLAYMSPEQVSGEVDGVDIRSDVYSLGVVLYELMTGRLPYDVRDRSLAHVAATISGEEPVSMRSVDRSLGGDLDVIAGKALAKHRSERYQTAAALADDLHRFLNDEPIHARPPTTWYRVRKFAQRNKVMVGAGLLLVVVLIASSIVSTSLFLRAKSESALKQQQTIEAEWQAYVANVAAAHGAIREGNAAEARYHLDTAPPHLRGWEWHYLDGLLDRSELLMLATHGVKDLAFNHDESVLFVGEDNGLLFAVDAETGEELRRVLAHPYWIHAIDYCADRNLIATCAEDGFVRIWEAESFDLVAEHSFGNIRLETVVWSVDGSTLFTGGREGVVYEFEAMSGQVIHRFDHDAYIASIRVAPDGLHITSLDADGLLRQWSLATGEVVASAEWGGPHETKHAATGPHGETVVFGDFRGLVSIHDLASQTMIKQFHAHESRSIGFAFSPDGSLLATTGHDSRIRLWETSEYRMIADFIDHSEVVTPVLFTADGLHLISGSGDHSVRAWSIDVETINSLTGQGEWVYSLDLLEDGMLVSAGGHSNRLAVWDLRTAEIIQTREGETGPIPHRVRSMSGGERIAFIESANLGIWNRDSGETITIGTPAEISDCAVCPDESWIAVVYFERHDIDIIDPVSATIVDRFSQPDGPTRTLASHRRVAVHPNRPVVAQTDRSRVVVVDRAAGTRRTIDLTEYIPRATATSLAFSLDGRLIAVGLFGAVVVLEAETGVPVATLACGAEENDVTALVFSSDNRRLFAADSRGMVRLWDIPSFRHVATLHAHDQRILSMDLSDDDTTLLTGSIDRTIRILRSAR